MNADRYPRPLPFWLTLPLFLVPFSEPEPAPDSEGDATDDGLRAFFEHCSDPLLVLDPGHCVLDFNDAACRFLSSSPTRLLGASVLEIDLLARLLTAASILQRLKTDPPPVSDRVSVSNSEGQAIQCRIEAIALGRGCTLVHLQDTTAVLRAQEATQTAERVHQALFEALPQVAWSMALPDERLLEVSPSVERLFGHQPAAFREHADLWDELVHPADRERVRAEFRQGLASARPFEIAFTGLHRDHRDLPHLVNRVIPVVDERGWMERCEGLIEDRSGVRHLTDTLEGAERALRHVMDTVSSGVVMVLPGEEELEIRLCNRRLADMLRLDTPVRPGTALTAAPEALQTLIRGGHGSADLQRLVLSEETQEDIRELKDPHRVLRRYAVPVRDALGGVVGQMIAVEDVTSSWLLQQRLTHAQKMESMGRLAGGVAHDFNNLLGSMLGFASLLLDQTPEGDSRRDPLIQIVESAERASRLTHALLAFSRSARFERVPVQLNRIVEEAYQLVRSGLDPSVAIELRLDPSIPLLLGDPILLQQVVVNLTQEAREALTDGGTLRLTTRAHERQVAGSTKPEPTVEMLIEISAPPRERLRAPGTPLVARDERAGLGLTIAEDITRAHGGYLISGAEAAPAMYRAVLPVNAYQEAPPIVPERATARGHETILVVDDEPGLRTLAKTGFQQRGFEVVTASSGEEALEILRAGSPPVDIVLLDLSLPGLSGERVLRTIRGFMRDLPVIIASGYATVESQAAWSTAGAQGFVAKPYRIQDVALKLRDVLDRAHGRVA